jgi:sorting nexin-29
MGNEPEEIEINGQRYENIEVFKYLGSLVTDTNEVETEIKARIIADNKHYYSLRHILKKIHITVLRVGLYKTTVRLILTHGAEWWTLTNNMERALMTLERKILRRT